MKNVEMGAFKRDVVYSREPALPRVLRALLGPVLVLSLGLAGFLWYQFHRSMDVASLYQDYVEAKNPRDKARRLFDLTKVLRTPEGLKQGPAIYNDLKTNLETTLASGDQETLRYTAFIASQIKDADPELTVLKGLSRVKDPLVRIAVLNGYAVHLEGWERHWPWAIRFLKDPSPQVRLQAVKLLGKAYEGYGLQKAWKENLSKVADDSNIHVSWEALIVLGSGDFASVRDRLIRLIDPSGVQALALDETVTEGLQLRTISLFVQNIDEEIRLVLSRLMMYSKNIKVRKTVANLLDARL